MSAAYDPEEEIGFHFHPTDEELIKDYLIPKIEARKRGEICEQDLIIATKDVYAMEPSLLVDHNNDPFFLEDEWYYFTPRKQISGKKIGCGKNSKRMITGDNDGVDRGGWKQNNKKEIKEEETGKTIGIIENLTYFPRNSKKKQKRGGDCGASASATVPGSEKRWIMNQYTLPDDGKFQNLVLCRIHTKKTKKKDDDLHESSSSSEQQPTNINSESVVAASSEHIAYPCSSAGTERNREQSGEANMVPQIAALSMTKRVPKNTPRSDWLFPRSKDYRKSLTMNRSGVPVNTLWRAPNLLDEASTSTHHESSSSEQQQMPINSCNKIQEKKKPTKKKDDHHKARIPHHYESSYSEINETHLHYPEIPRVLSMSNSAAETERNEKHNGEENMVHQIDPFSSIKLDEDFKAAMMAMERDEADAPNLKWMDHDH